ncbi:hypothetical protein [Haloprofundus salinisoli]|uniref:hypothetical protein n=1 Tax=Haloprofundus salinisoli TaxID=2876193 RepID=UPI001CCA993F|nr:hypothetical protein [Haloprofundus salinisoli]
MDISDSHWWRRLGVGSARPGSALTFVGGAAHLFGDILSAPDIARPIEPLWPFASGSPAIEIVYYDSNPVNFGLFAAGVLFKVGLWQWRRRLQPRRA